MKYLLDTNIISELRKVRPNQQVVDWLKNTEQQHLYLSCITIGEIKTGILKKQLQDKVVSASLLKWLNIIIDDYAEHILNIDLDVCEQWAELLIKDSTNAVDALLAAQAINMNMVLVTRNIKHFVKFNVKLLNPFE